MRQLFFSWCFVSLFTLFSISASSMFGQEVADELSDMELIERVAFLQHQLESPEVSKRDEAEKELISHGVRVLDYLEPTTDKTPTDAVERTNRIRQQLEKIAVASVTKASLVTIKETLPLKQALDKIRKQTKNDVAMPEGTPDVLANRKIELNLENASFWEALAEIMKQGELVVDPYAGQPGQLRVTPSDSARIAAANPNAAPQNKKPPKAATPPASVSGIFKTSITQVVASRNLANPELNYCNLNLRVRWEPRITPISIDLPCSKIKAVDEYKHAIGMPNPEAVLSGTVLREIPELEFSIPIGLVDRQIEVIQSLEATIDAVIPGRVESFKFKNIGNLAAGSIQNKAGAIVTFGGISKNEDLFGVTVGLSFDEGHSALESYRSWVRDNEMYLLDTEGNRVDFLADDLVGQTETEVTMRYYFEHDPKRMALVYKTPAAIVRIPVKIQIENIPLP